jgi:catechol 2,3-dioxygenase-like lactoylglutathione lyase family enzyme
MKSITANLFVPSIEDCLAFYVDRLGFEKTVAVPHGNKIGFVILKHGDAELMLQSHASVKGDLAGVDPGVFLAAIYIDVEKLAPIRKALAGWPPVIPERTTPYGAREIFVRDPAGNLVGFASRET